jgi:hypothetical protein
MHPGPAADDDGAAPGGWVDDHTFKGSPRPIFKLDDVAYLVGRFPVRAAAARSS